MFSYLSLCVVRLQVAFFGVIFGEEGPEPTLASDGASQLTGARVGRVVEAGDVIDGDVVDRYLVAICSAITVVIVAAITGLIRESSI